MEWHEETGMHGVSLQGQRVVWHSNCKWCVDRLIPLKTVWPSGLRRWLKAPFRKGVGSNPTGVNLFPCTQQVPLAC